MGDILSQEEIDAILVVKEATGRDIQRWLTALPMAERDQYQGRKLTAKELATLKGAYDKGMRDGTLVPSVISYDFKHPARVNKDQLRTLENLHDSFARLLSSTLSGAMRAVVDVDTAFVDQTTYAEFIMSLSNPACSYQFTLNPTGGQAIMDIAMPIVCGMVDRVHGGKGSPKGVEARQVTPIEMGVMAKIVKRAVEDLEATWEPIVRAEISDIELETNPEFMQITAASEIVILLAFEINATNMSGLISLCYPFFTLEPILPRLGQPSYVRTRRQDRQTQGQHNRLLLGGMDLPAVAELGRARISASEADALQEGDVIRLSTRTTDPVRLYVGGKAKFLGWPYAEADGDLKLRLAGKVPPQARQRYESSGTRRLQHGNPAIGQSWLPAPEVLEA